MVNIYIRQTVNDMTVTKTIDKNILFDRIETAAQ